jgi:hypothetical protein
MINAKEYTSENGEMPIVVISDGNTYCHGVLVDASAVVSPASCVADFAESFDKGEVYVDFYVDGFRPFMGKSDSTEKSLVSSINLHPDFDSNTLDNNIALVTFDASAAQKPANMVTSDFSINGGVFTAYSRFVGSPPKLESSMHSLDFKDSSEGKGPAGTFSLDVRDGNPGHFSSVFDQYGFFVGFTFNQSSYESGLAHVLNISKYGEFIEYTIANPGSGKPSGKPSESGTVGKGTLESMQTEESTVKETEF